MTIESQHVGVGLAPTLGLDLTLGPAPTPDPFLEQLLQYGLLISSPTHGRVRQKWHV